VTRSTSSVTLNKAKHSASGSCSMTMTVKECERGPLTSARAGKRDVDGADGSKSAAASALADRDGARAVVQWIGWT